MTVKEIIQKYLRDNGYDGVVNIDMECGCTTDDYPLCEEPLSECQPAYYVKCADCKDDGCPFWAEKREGCFQPTKPEAPCQDK